MDVDSQEDLFNDDDGQMEYESQQLTSELPCHVLECHGEDRLENSCEDVPCEGLLRAGDFRVLSRGSCAHDTFLQKTSDFRLFGSNFEPGLALLDHHDVLFQMARKNFFILEHDAIKTSTQIGPIRAGKHDYFKIRKEICYLFSYVRSYLLSTVDNFEYGSVSEEITPHMHTPLQQWRLMLSGFSTLPHYVVANCPSALGNKCLLASHHLFHSHLELRWYHLTVLYALDRSENPTQPQTRQLLEKNLVLFLTELTHLAETIYTSCRDKEKNHTPFLCTCVREMWLLLQIFADKLHAWKELSMPFWGLMEQVLKPCLAKERSHQRYQTPPETPNCSQLPSLRLGNDATVDKPSMCLWLLLHLTKLYGFSENGLYMGALREGPVEEFGPVVKLVLQHLLPSREEIKEVRLREILMTLLTLPPWWPLGIDPILDLWEIFHKRISCLYSATGEPLSTSAIVGKSASGFAQQIQQYLKAMDRPEEEENSYTMFLRFLAQQLKIIAADENNKERHFSKLKGRIYPKFSSTRMTTMSEIGIHNISSLMLLLALTTDMHDVGDKLRSMLESVPRGGSASKREVVWRSHLALLYLRTERGLSITVASEPLVHLLELNASKLSSLSVIENQLMRLFVEALQDIAEVAPGADFRFHSLIGRWLTIFLEISLIPDVCRTLDAIQAVANKVGPFNPHLSGTDSGELELFRALQQFVLPFLKSQSQGANPPPQKVADLAVSLTLASPDTEFKELFQFFVGTENVNARVTSRYLSQILSNPVAMERIHDKISNFHHVTIQAWIRCCLLAGENRSELTQLTLVVIKLPQMETLCQGSEDLLLSTDEPLETLAVVLDSKLKSSETIFQRNDLKKQTLQCLGRLDKVAESALKNGRPSPALVSRLYRTIGVFFRYCSPLIYTQQDTRSLFYCLVNVMLLPNEMVLDPDYRLPSDFENAIKKTLPMYLDGLLQVVHRDSPKTAKDYAILYKMVTPKNYGQRTIRSIVVHYANRLVSEQQASHHPLLKCFDSEVKEMAFYLFDAMASIFHDKIVRAYFAATTQVMHMLIALLVDRGDYDKAMVLDFTYILSYPLLYQYSCYNEEPLKNLMGTVLRSLINCVAFRENKDAQDVFQRCLHAVAVKLMAFQQTHLFSTLHFLARSRPTILIPALPMVRQVLADVEAKRASGRDANLRGLLSKLESELGSVAHE